LGSPKVASDLINKGFCKNPMGLLCRLFKLTQLAQKESFDDCTAA
jgi:hypothetical protein